MAYGSFNAGPGKAPDEDVVRTNQIGVPGGIATLDADGHLTESQRPTVDAYTKAQTDQKISSAVDAHNSAENAHGDIRASVAAMNASIKAIELKFGTNVTKNPFSATFGSLDGLTVTGVWNAEQARVELKHSRSARMRGSCCATLRGQPASSPMTSAGAMPGRSSRKSQRSKMCATSRRCVALPSMHSTRGTGRAFPKALSGCTARASG